jgi:hypothetical protein
MLFGNTELYNLYRKLAAYAEYENGIHSTTNSATTYIRLQHSPFPSQVGHRTVGTNLRMRLIIRKILFKQQRQESNKDDRQILPKILASHAKFSFDQLDEYACATNTGVSHGIRPEVGSKIRKKRSFENRDKNE